MIQVPSLPLLYPHKLDNVTIPVLLSVHKLYDSLVLSVFKHSFNALAVY